MKKLALAAVALSFVAVCLAGCKKEETPGQKLDHAADNMKKAADDMKK